MGAREEGGGLKVLRGGGNTGSRQGCRTTLFVSHCFRPSDDQVRESFSGEAPLYGRHPQLSLELKHKLGQQHFYCTAVKNRRVQPKTAMKTRNP